MTTATTVYWYSPTGFPADEVQVTWDEWERLMYRAFRGQPPLSPPGFWCGSDGTTGRVEHRFA